MLKQTPINIFIIILSTHSVNKSIKAGTFSYLPGFLFTSFQLRLHSQQQKVRLPYPREDVFTTEKTLSAFKAHALTAFIVTSEFPVKIARHQQQHAAASCFRVYFSAHSVNSQSSEGTPTGNPLLHRLVETEVGGIEITKVLASYRDIVGRVCKVGAACVWVGGVHDDH